MLSSPWSVYCFKSYFSFGVRLLFMYILVFFMFVQYIILNKKK